MVIVADQLDELCERVASDHRMGFDTERRFIETATATSAEARALTSGQGV